MAGPNDRADVSANNDPNAGETDGEILDDNDEGGSADAGDADSDVEDSLDAEGDAAGGDEDNGEADDVADVDEGLDGERGVAAERGRRPNKFAALRERAQAAERAAAEALRQVEEFKRQPNAAEIERRRTERQAYLATLTPEERAEERIRETEQRLTGELRRTQFALGDQNDKASYEAKARVNPLYSKYQDKVEQFLANERRQGRDVRRETVLDFLIGRDARMKAEKTGTRRTNRAAQNVARETVRPNSGRSDAVGRGGKAGGLDTRAARAKRLSGVQL